MKQNNLVVLLQNLMQNVLVVLLHRPGRSRRRALNPPRPDSSGILQLGVSDPDEGLTLEELLLREGSLTAVEREARREQRRAEAPGSSTRYQIETRLGEGAVAVVYRAMDRELQRPVAIKVLRQVSALNEIARKRF